MLALAAHILESCFGDLAGLQLSILLSQLSKWWDYRCVLSCQANLCLIPGIYQNIENSDEENMDGDGHKSRDSTDLYQLTDVHPSIHYSIYIIDSLIWATLWVDIEYAVLDKTAIVVKVAKVEILAHIENEARIDKRLPLGVIQIIFIN